MGTYLAILVRLMLDFLALAAACWLVVGGLVLADRRTARRTQPRRDVPAGRAAGGAATVRPFALRGRSDGSPRLAARAVGQVNPPGA
ncbi:MAG TPA: hypothetical protein VKW76_03405 [Candidatus Binatia bacterium]|nr:hypothetical protein [Candidatus Binatia bacterium]